MRRARRRNHKAAICDETNNGMFSAKEEKGERGGEAGSESEWREEERADRLPPLSRLLPLSVRMEAEAVVKK